MNISYITKLIHKLQQITQQKKPRKPNKIINRSTYRTSGNLHQRTMSWVGVQSEYA